MDISCPKALKDKLPHNIKFIFQNSTVSLDPTSWITVISKSNNQYLVNINYVSDIFSKILFVCPTNVYLVHKLHNYSSLALKKKHLEICISTFFVNFKFIYIFHNTKLPNLNWKIQNLYRTKPKQTMNLLNYKLKIQINQLNMKQFNINNKFSVKSSRTWKRITINKQKNPSSTHLEPRESMNHRWKEQTIIRWYRYV